MQAGLYDKRCRRCQQFKKRKTLYGSLTPNNISELKPWDKVHVDLIGCNINFIRQQQTGVTTTNSDVNPACKTMTNPATDLF